MIKGDEKIKRVYDKSIGNCNTVYFITMAYTVFSPEN